MRADRDDQLGAPVVRELERDVLADARRGTRCGTASAEPLEPRRRPGARPSRVGVDEELGARARALGRRRSRSRRRSRRAGAPPRAARPRRRRRRRAPAGSRGCTGAPSGGRSCTRARGRRRARAGRGTASRSGGKSMPFASRWLSSRRWRSVLSANASSASATRALLLREARLRASGSSSAHALGDQACRSARRSPLADGRSCRRRRARRRASAPGDVDEPHAAADELERAGVREAPGRATARR